MDEANSNQAAIERYLLGQMSEEEQRGFEESYFANVDLGQLVREGRNDLIDMYVRNELGAEERELFERRLLTSPNLRKGLEFAGSFHQKLGASVASHIERGRGPTNGTTVTNRKVLRTYLPLAAALMMVLTITLLITKRNSRNDQSRDLAVVQSPVASSRPDVTASVDTSLPMPTSSPTAATRKTSTATILLRSDLTRHDSATRELRIGADAIEVVIRAEVNVEDWSNYSGHEVTVSTPEGKVIWKGEGSTVRLMKPDEVIEIKLAARTLVPGDYVLRLIGTRSGHSTSSLGHFYLSVVRD